MGKVPPGIRTSKFRVRYGNAISVRVNNNKNNRLTIIAKCLQHLTFSYDGPVNRVLFRAVTVICNCSAVPGVAVTSCDYKFSICLTGTETSLGMRSFICAKFY